MNDLEAIVGRIENQLGQLVALQCTVRALYIANPQAQIVVNAQLEQMSAALLSLTSNNSERSIEGFDSMREALTYSP